MLAQVAELAARIPWLLFAPACFALALAPGPNNLTAFVNGARLSLGPAVLACAGRLPAFAILIVITAIGLGAALAASTSALWLIKILGAAYLIYIGVRMLRTRAADAIDPGAQSFWPLAKQDFLVAIGNPKAIAIFTAFFPQFLVSETNVAAQILIMGAVFLALEFVAAVTYVIGGRVLGGAVRRAGFFDWIQKSVGGFLVFSGISMAASSR